MAAALTVTCTRSKISRVQGYDTATVTVSSDTAYEQLSCRATKSGTPYGYSVGVQLASFPATAAGVARTFTITGNDLTDGDGEYRVSLYVMIGGVWEDGIPLFDEDGLRVRDSGGNEMLVLRGTDGADSYTSAWDGASMDAFVSAAQLLQEA